MISRLRGHLETVFSIDVRALAWVRVGLAATVLVDLATRIPDMVVFYGDKGLLPVALTQTFWTGDWALSLHTLFGGPLALLVALFAIHAIVAFALLIGFYTRSATTLTWLLLVSLHNANPMILQGEDVLLRVILFVCIFLPLGAVMSVDSVRAGSGMKEKTVLSGWTIAYLLQMAFMYFFVSLYKHSPEWYSGSAIYYALSIDQYATSFGKYMLHFPSLLHAFTITILIFQSFALFLFFSPIYRVYVRTLTVLGLMLMHAGFALCMHLGMFSSVAIIGLIGFIPSEVWDLLAKRFAFLTAYVREFARSFVGASVSVSRSRFAKTASVISLLGIFYIIYIFAWHTGNVFRPGQYVPFGGGWELPAKVLRIDQRWNLFAPRPYLHDGWFIVTGTKENGEQVDLFRQGGALSFEKPNNVFATYPSPRWRRYVLNLWENRNNTLYREAYAQYLCASWNSGHDTSEKITDIELVYMLERTPPPGFPAPTVERVSMLRWDCEEGRAQEESLTNEPK